MSSKELVVNMDDGMGNSAHIKLMSVEDSIHSNEVAMVYLQEGGMLLYMEGMVKHGEIISMQFFQTWKDEKVIFNGMSFDISEETIARAGEFYMEGKKWQRQAKVNEESRM